MNNKYEEKEICKKCGGLCCKKSGCDYFISDFKNINLKSLEEILKTGRVSIVSTFYFKTLASGKMVYTPILYLRERNTNRDIIDLFSFKTKCASLEEDGCYYDLDKRPSGGAALIPCSNEPCYSKVDREAELKKWLSYQKVLERLVKRYTGMTVAEKIEEDVKVVIYNCLTQNYKDSALIEIKEIISMLPILEKCFPKSYEKAVKEYKTKNPIMQNNLNIKKKSLTNNPKIKL